MSLKEEILGLIKQPENESVEFKAVLPPSRVIAKIIASFANTEGGYLILGVLDNGTPKGLSGDFFATETVHKAIDLLTPRPIVNYEYVDLSAKRLFVIKTEKSNNKILFENDIYIRVGEQTQLSAASGEPEFTSQKYPKVTILFNDLIAQSESSTESKRKYFEHIKSILKIIDDLGNILYPDNVETITTNQEGKILSRILYSSFTDNFETYLSDLLFEIFLAKPETLKSKQEVTIEEVLNCSDMQDFVHYWAKQKIGKLQKGSVKGFIEDTKQIKDLDVLGAVEIKEIDKLLQIRHLFSHRNGIVDEKFLKFYSNIAPLNSEFNMAISDIVVKLEYLIEIVNRIDTASIQKYNLST
ncbi:MAG: ATP-binding protein [Sulfuricurvum sp.]|uniref:AlbA family DNA-binding domain-containing protein n=1 Tax=Sulfuricurvum sp. TaxID=2025608 RepID=UPI002637551C|nr:ATP-binding protein [Sulfuricurvum sp.]MDD2949246.1 ATP-binding protein [Sulfuricurvum sp.]MDD5119186.1 ATP-binding protein [Sulfuricurvum sp.]